jgi:CBS domain-containing protein
MKVSPMSYQIRNYMRTEISTVDAGVSAARASELMSEKNIGYLIVLNKDQPAGMLTEHDLVRKVMAKGKDPSQVQVSEIMSSPLITIDPDATVEDAVKAMAKHRIRRLPVVEGNVIHGIFTTQDLTRHFREYEDRVANDIINAQTLYGISPDLSFDG